jgi:hypothetical protein
MSIKPTAVPTHRLGLLEPQPAVLGRTTLPVKSPPRTCARRGFLEESTIDLMRPPDAQRCQAFGYPDYFQFLAQPLLQNGIPINSGMALLMNLSNGDLEHLISDRWVECHLIKRVSSKRG